MAHTYEDLHKMTVAQLREIAKGLDHEAVRGYSTMHKHELLPALCTAFGIETHEHHEAIGIDKTVLKAQIRDLKVKRDAALEARDAADVKDIRRKIKRLKRKIRRATV
jgi:DNA-binding IclR family transcriptional regulator